MFKCRDRRNPHDAMVKCIVQNWGMGYKAIMIVLKIGIIWGSDLMMIQEPVIEKGGTK